MLIRPPAVAGMFYPAEAGALAGVVDACLAGARVRHAPPKALIAPHAGFVYSGPIAGTVYAPLAPLRGLVRRVVLLGPSHRVAFGGMAVSSADAFDTPLGAVWVDRPGVATALAQPGVEVLDSAHAREHSLEVQLPFLMRVLGDFKLVPVVVGDARPEAVDRLLAALWGGPETLIVVSSDLSHYHDYATAQGYDRAASRAIEVLRADEIADHQACGRLPIKGLLHRARALDMRATTLDLRNSGDTRGDRGRVVGYGGYVFEYSGAARLAEEQRGMLLEAAVRTIARGPADGKPPPVETGGFPPQLLAARACFVTLELDGALRGCVGSIQAHRPLVEDVVANAYKSAFGDRRFASVGAAELPRLAIGISVLSTPRPIEVGGEAELIRALRPDVDGVILAEGDRRGLFLPQVWKSLPAPGDFLRRLKEKAGLAPDHWSGDIRAYRFTTESFGRAPAA